MNTPQETTEQITVDEFLERQAGSPVHRAIVLADLESAAYAAYEEFRHDSSEDGLPEEIIAALKLLSEFEFTVPWAAIHTTPRARG